MEEVEAVGGEEVEEEVVGVDSLQCLASSLLFVISIIIMVL